MNEKHTTPHHVLEHVLHDALPSWRALECFDALAEDVLERLLLLSEQLAHGQDATCLRATLYMRPGDAYRAVIARQRVEIPAHQMLSSATMWQWVSERGEPLLLDTTLGVLLPCRDAADAVEIDDPRDSAISWAKHSSLVLLLERDATHVLLLPIHDLRGEVGGMVSVEIAHDEAMGTLGIWADGGELGLQQVLELAAPFLLDRMGSRGSTNVELDAGPLIDDLLPVVGETMRGRLEILQAFAAQEETLLLTGETGVGKSRLARWCHERSSRSAGPMESLDLSAVPEEMQVAHLMGWYKGAFTSAVSDVQGAVELADGGTLFIDEIDKLSLDTQSSLLGLLESYTYRRLGSQKLLQANVRFIVGTNADLRELVSQGKFRADLYFRICVLPVHVLPLRARTDELGAWAHYMFARALGRDVEIEPGATHLLEQEEWPGNLRQLDNVVRRTVALMGMREHDDRVTEQDIRQALRMASSNLLQGQVQFTTSLLAAMTQVATQYVSLSKRRVERGEAPIDVEALEALCGLAYEQAMSRTEDLEQALEWLGKKALFRNRNHQRTIARERQRVEALRALLEG